MKSMDSVSLNVIPRCLSDETVRLDGDLRQFAYRPVAQYNCTKSCGISWQNGKLKQLRVIISTKEKQRLPVH